MIPIYRFADFSEPELMVLSDALTRFCLWVEHQPLNDKFLSRSAETELACAVRLADEADAAWADILRREHPYG